MSILYGNQVESMIRQLVEKTGAMLSFLIGQSPKIPAQKKAFTIAVGQCASKQDAADLCIDECPPTAGSIYRSIASATAKS